MTHCPIYYWYINTEHAKVLRVSYLRCWTMKSPVILCCVDDIILTVQLYKYILGKGRPVVASEGVPK